MVFQIVKLHTNLKSLPKNCIYLFSYEVFKMVLQYNSVPGSGGQSEAEWNTETVEAHASQQSHTCLHGDTWWSFANVNLKQPWQQFRHALANDNLHVVLVKQGSVWGSW